MSNCVFSQLEMSIGLNFDQKIFKKTHVFEISEFSFLSFYRFLLVSKGPELSRKMREAISCNLAPVRSKSDVMEPSYDQKTVLKKKYFNDC